MMIVIGLVWSAVMARCVFSLLEREATRRMDAEDWSLRAAAPDPTVGAVATFFFAPFAFYFLGKCRGIRGVAEALGIVALGSVGSFATALVLVLALR